MRINGVIPLVAVGMLCACDVPDNVPFPVVEGRITAFEVDGQCSASGSETGVAEIDRTRRTVNLYVCDTVDLKNLRVKRIELRGESKNPDFTYQDRVTLLPDSTACADFATFPRFGFDRTAAGENTCMDFSHEVRFVLSTYQDYEWTVSVTQIVGREVEVENQVGNAVIDPCTQTVLIYVKENQPLNEIKVKKFALGGTHGTVSPNPLIEETSDFSDIRTFRVRTGWGEEQEWCVLVFNTDAAVPVTASAFARTLNATVSGEKPNESNVNIAYQKQGEGEWHNVPQVDMECTSTSYKALIKNLQPGTTYSYRVSAGESVTEIRQFTTTEVLQLENASFDEWCEDEKNAKLIFPWAQGGTPYWDTGNKGATTVGSSNSVPTEDTSIGHGRAAYLESKYIVIKFAAGNIFTGSYLRTDGTNGILGFGRPFTAYPTRLTFDYKFHPEKINKIGDEAQRYMEGQPDSCQVYIALWHLEPDEYEEYNGERFPIIIRTRPSERRLFSPNDPRVIAYAQLTQGDDVPNWTSHTLELQYKDDMRVPTHIQVVASSSKYGDYFTGGVGTLLVLDNMQLHYD